MVKPIARRSRGSASPIVANMAGDPMACHAMTNAIPRTRYGQDRPETPRRKPPQRCVQIPESLLCVPRCCLRLAFPNSRVSTYFSSAEGSVRLSALHHFFAVGVQRIVNNPLCRVDFVVVPKIQ